MGVRIIRLRLIFGPRVSDFNLFVVFVCLFVGWVVERVCSVVLSGVVLLREEMNM